MGFHNIDHDESRDIFIDAYQCLKGAMTSETLTYEGEYFRFGGIVSNPKPAQPGGVPIMIGGHSEAAARRAGRHGDEFYPHWSTRGPSASSATGSATSFKGGAS